MSESQALPHQEETKKSIEKTISNPLWLGYEELKRTMGFSKSKEPKVHRQDANFITPDLDKYEQKLIGKRKISA